VTFGERVNPLGFAPCTRRATVLSWSSNQISVQVPSMAPGLAGYPSTYHNVRVYVGGSESNDADFYIPPAITIDASTAAGSILPNSTRTVQTITYPSSPNRDGNKVFTTTSTYNCDTGPQPTYSNYVASGTHDVLFKDCTFIATRGQINPNNDGVLTMGSLGYPGGQHDIYNITFLNCVIQNNTTAGSNGEGVNGIKVYHNGPGRWGDWTFAECSIGTPNTTTGSFRRMGIELVEPTAGLGTYNTTTPNYLQNIRVSGCDFETMGCMGFSFAAYCRGPDRNVLIDDCTFKGNAGPTTWGSSMLEFSGTGMEVRDTDFWAWKSSVFLLEGDATDIGGLSLAGIPCHRYFKNLTVDRTHVYGEDNEHGATINADHQEYAIWDNCDFNLGNPTSYAGGVSYYWGVGANLGFDSCYHTDMSTSYIHGYVGVISGYPTRSMDYWRVWNLTNPATAYADNDVRWPIFGMRP